ncbi:MAG: methyltransferase domain-containing protein [Candidatus Hydrogenedentales bacterium]
MTEHASLTSGDGARLVDTRSREAASKGAHQRVFELLRAHVPEGRVLDLPCGSGAFTRRLLEAGYEATGGDVVSHPAVPQEHFRIANMNEKLPFGDASFDAVVSIEGIEHIERPFDFVRECRRVLRSGGTLLITTPNISSLRSRWRWFLTGFHNKCKYPLDETQPEPRHHINMLSYPALRYMLHTNRFHIETVATNRIKAASWLYLPWTPIQWAAGAFLLPRGGKTAEHQRVIGESRRHLKSAAVQFGETLITVARCT